MYYEEIWINGVLHSRGTPNGNWSIVRDPVVIAKATMIRLTDDQRMEVMAAFCAGCGTTHKPCHCQNDE